MQVIVVEHVAYDFCAGHLKVKLMGAMLVQIG